MIVGNRELKEVDNFKYLENVLTGEDYCRTVINITTAKEAFN